MSLFRLSTEPIILLYYSIVYINYTVLPQLILTKICLRKNSYNATLCEDNINISADINKEATRWWFYLLLSFQIPGVFTVLISGPITDIIGRLKGLKCIPFLDALGAFVFLLNAYFIECHPAFLIPGYLIISLFGEGQGTISLCFAYVADITKDKHDHRTPKMALGEASLHLSGVVGGLIANCLLNEFGFVVVFLFSICIDGVIFLYVSCYLSRFNKDDPSSSSETVRLIQKHDGSEEAEDNDVVLNYSHDDRDGDANANNNNNDEITDGFSHIKKYFQQMKGLLIVIRERKIVIFMIISFMFIFFGVLGEQLIQTLYLKRPPYSFTSIYVGYYTAVQGVSRFVGTVLISQISFYCLRCNDFVLMVIGACSQLVSFIFIGLSKSTLEVFLSNAAAFALPLSMMSIRSVLTKNVFSDEFGTILALLASLNILSGIVTNTISSFIHQMTLVDFAGIVYFGLAAFTGAGLLVIIATYVMIACRQNENSN